MDATKIQVTDYQGLKSIFDASSFEITPERLLLIKKGTSHVAAYNSDRWIKVAMVGAEPAR